MALFRWGWWSMHQGVMSVPTEILGQIVMQPAARETSQVLLIEDGQGHRWRVIGPVIPMYHWGDRVVVNCRPPDDEVSVGWGCLARSIHLVTDGHVGREIGLAWLYEQSLERIRQLWPAPASEVAAGLLLGNKEGLPADLQTTIRRTGMSHIFAVSGGHIVLLLQVVIACLLTMGLHRRWALLAGLIILIAYVIMIGLPASGLRALLMGAVGIGAASVGRRYVAWWSLTLTILVMIIIWPAMVTNVGWQLSVAAVIGLLAWQEPLQRLFDGWPFIRRAPRLMRETLAMTLAAQIATWPIVVFVFGQWSLISPAVNLIMVPVVPFLMIGDLIALTVSALSPMLGQGIGWLLWWAMKLWVGIMVWFDQWRGVVWDDRPISQPHIIMVGLLMAILAIRSLARQQRGVYADLPDR